MEAVRIEGKIKNSNIIIANIIINISDYLVEIEVSD